MANEKCSDPKDILAGTNVKRLKLSFAMPNKSGFEALSFEAHFDGQSLVLFYSNGHRKKALQKFRYAE